MIGDELTREWAELIDSDRAREESVLQGFLERHPFFLPGSRTLDGTSGKPPWPHAIISQPRLTGLSTKIPDFMWIAWDSARLYPICIEIETPFKKWWHSDQLVQHSDLTVATTQVAHWRRFFQSPTGQQRFLDDYRIDRELRELALSPRYLIIHGRRREASRSRDAVETRAGLPLAADTRLHTFDSLFPDRNAEEYFTVGLNDAGFFLHPNSPAVDARQLPDDVRFAVRGLDTSGTGTRPGHRFTPPPRRT